MNYVYCLLSSISVAYASVDILKDSGGSTSYTIPWVRAHPGNLYKVKSEIGGFMSIKSFS